MSLYKQINNEALDEDLAVQRALAERIRASVKDNKEKIRATIKMSGIQKTEIVKAIELIKKYIFKLYATIADQGFVDNVNFDKISKNIADIVLTWNSFVGLLQSINFNKMQMDDRKYIESLIKDLPGLLSAIGNYYVNRVPDFFLVPLSTLAEEISSTNIDRGESYGLISYPEGTIVSNEAQKQFVKRISGNKYPKLERVMPPRRRREEPEEPEEEPEEEDEDAGYDPEEEERLRELGGQPEEDF